MGSMMYMSWMRIFSSPHVPRFKMVQFKFPRTKKKRIQKKWRKNQKNFRQVPVREAMVLNGDTMIIHPDDMKLIKRISGRY
jgi:hypothetical protein